VLHQKKNEGKREKAGKKRRKDLDPGRGGLSATVGTFLRSGAGGYRDTYGRNLKNSEKNEEKGETKKRRVSESLLHGTKAL